jgi:hypothetical protein
VDRDLASYIYRSIKRIKLYSFNRIILGLTYLSVFEYADRFQLNEIRVIVVF